MPAEPGHQKLIALAFLGLFVPACAGMTGWSLLERAKASGELARHRDVFARLAAESAKGKTRVAAPTSALLEGPTQGLAGGQLQSYVAEIARTETATLVAISMETARQGDPPDILRAQVTFEASWNVLQTILYRLEAGVPYIVVDALTVQIGTTANARSAEDPVLRCSLGLLALLRPKGS
jgi:hypothetical protein